MDLIAPLSRRDLKEEGFPFDPQPALSSCTPDGEASIIIGITGFWEFHRFVPYEESLQYLTWRIIRLQAHFNIKYFNSRKQSQWKGPDEKEDCPGES